MKKNQLNIHKPTCSCSWLTTSISHSASVHENPPKRNEPTAPQNDDLDASVLFVSEYSNANPPVINLCSPEPPTRHGHQVCENTTVQASSPDRFTGAQFVSGTCSPGNPIPPPVATFFASFV
ncbi:hypothetical protein DMENIID0001_112230 [Sergentomyia squamirostris]